MAKTIVVCGYGPGISHAVARHFGEQGFHVALAGRRVDNVARGAATLTEAGVRARGFACDLAQPAAVTKLIEDARAELGPIDVLHWNAYAPIAKDLSVCDVNELRAGLDVAVVGLTAAVQAALPDLRTQPDAAVLVTNGGLARDEPAMNALAVQFGAMGLAIAKAAQHKWVSVMHAQLSSSGIFVGEVMVQGIVKGTAADRGQTPNTLDPQTIAQRFWELYQAREAVTVTVP